MNNSMVAHLWANEKEESARGSNLFFEGRSIYSYGYHFEVGRIVRNNSYKNDILVAGCHRIAYSEMKGIARQLGWD